MPRELDKKKAADFVKGFNEGGTGEFMKNLSKAASYLTGSDSEEEKKKKEKQK